MRGGGQAGTDRLPVWLPGQRPVRPIPSLAEAAFLRAGLSEEHARLRAKNYINDVLVFSRELTEKAMPMMAAIRWPQMNAGTAVAARKVADTLARQIAEAAIAAYQSSKMREALRQIAAAEAL